MLVLLVDLVCGCAFGVDFSVCCLGCYMFALNACFVIGLLGTLRLYDCLWFVYCLIVGVAWICCM